jgi:hypothetical protein
MRSSSAPVAGAANDALQSDGPKPARQPAGGGGNQLFYVTGIANRIGRFQQEVGRHPYTQNFFSGAQRRSRLGLLLPIVTERAVRS